MTGNGQPVQGNNREYEVESDVFSYSTSEEAYLNGNERSYAIRLISEINEYLHGKDMRIKRAGGERTINAHSFVKFPDVLLFSDKRESMILQGWEIKCPDVRIDDIDFVNDAHEKAELLQCNSCVLWNSHYAQLHVKQEDGSYAIERAWTISDHINNRRSIDVFQQEWIDFLYRLIDQIDSFIATGRIRHRALGDVLTESVMPKVVSDNKSLVADELKRRNASDVRVSMDIGTWWSTARKEYLLDESDAFLAYAKLVLVNWMNKLLFANLIQAHHEAARSIKDIDGACTVADAIDVFDAITDRCDFFNMFATLEHGDALPEETWEDLLSFNGPLLVCDIKSLDSEYQHRLLEDNISLAKRQIAGQYPTPEALACLMSEMAVRNAAGNSWDCCCGTGTIGRAIWKRKFDLLDDVYDDAANRAFDTTWLSDIHDFPLQIATMSMSSLAQTDVPLLVFRENVFDVTAGQHIGLVDPATGNEVERAVPLFETIVSNLPFVDFNTSEVSWYDSAKRQINDELVKQDGVRLSGRNDLYGYITLYLRNLMSDSGIACVLTSSSWLVSSAGESFFHDLNAVYDIDGIYVNGKARWFANADVMNAVLLLKPKAQNGGLSVRFGVISASIEELKNDEIRERIARSVITESDQAGELFAEASFTQVEIAALREAGFSYYSLCFNSRFMVRIISKLCKIGDHFSFSRQLKSGQNDAFYSSDPCFVDKEFRFGLVKDLSDTSSYEIKVNKYAFSCKQSEEYLLENGFERTASHIRSFDDKLNESVLSHRPYWYSLPDEASFTLATAMNPYRRLFFARIPEGISCFADQRVIGLAPRENDTDIPLALALLNTVLGMFLMEANAGPMALGALDTRKEKMSQMMMLDPTTPTPVQRERILKAFEPLKKRPIMDTADELQQDDRKAFDAVVLDVYGIEWAYDEIAEALMKMQNVRLK